MMSLVGDRTEDGQQHEQPLDHQSNKTEDKYKWSQSMFLKNSIILLINMYVT